MKLFWNSANQNKNNFRFTTVTKQVNNQTNCRIALEKLKKIWICLIFFQLYFTSENISSLCAWRQFRRPQMRYKAKMTLWVLYQYYSSTHPTQTNPLCIQQCLCGGYTTVHCVQFGFNFFSQLCRSQAQCSEKKSVSIPIQVLQEPCRL